MENPALLSQTGAEAAPGAPAAAGGLRAGSPVLQFVCGVLHRDVSSWPGPLTTGAAGERSRKRLQQPEPAAAAAPDQTFSELVIMFSSLV